MHTFFADNEIIPMPGQTLLLNEEESKHATKAMRLKDGDCIMISSGKGIKAKARILNIFSRELLLEIESREEFVRNIPQLHLAVAPTKNPDRFEWFIEKATELGIESITPLICENSERSKLRHDRLIRIAIAAMKQSERSFMPVISEAVPFNDFIHSSVLQNRYIAWCETGKEDLWQTAYPVGQPAIMLIGPEGDFSPKEINLAKENNFLPVSLGQARLRTETAAMYVAASFTFLNETGSPYIPSL